MVKTNLITGFLGSGKTTTIQHLLAQKPIDESWAILINEFGEIGIDAALLTGQGAYLKEIPGGCLCCVNGLPMQVGLNMLLQQAKPDRLLIEPTGLGHPKQVLKLLTSAVYQSYIELQATLCLLDARQLSDTKYNSNQSFRDQLAAADLIVANKSDNYQPNDLKALEEWQQLFGNGRQVIPATRGNINLMLLEQKRTNFIELPSGDQHHNQQNNRQTNGLAALSLSNNSALPWRRALNEGQGFVSCGWIFDAATCFSTAQLLDWVRLAPVERVKGVMRIAEGTLLVNRQGLDLHIETRAMPPIDSRVELINSTPIAWNTLQSALLAARLTEH